ncbi:hypothetical protein, partial [uncultured Oscillibacter sp.]
LPLSVCLAFTGFNQCFPNHFKISKKSPDVFTSGLSVSSLYQLRCLGLINPYLIANPYLLLRYKPA